MDDTPTMHYLCYDGTLEFFGPVEDFRPCYDCSDWHELKDCDKYCPYYQDPE